MESSQKWILFFAMGSQLGQYFCRFEAPTAGAAERRAWKRYPTHVTRVVPDDFLAEANIKLYQKSEIPFGATLQLTTPSDDEPMGRD